jgi:RNA polymerase sigma-54 factor
LRWCQNLQGAYAGEAVGYGGSGLKLTRDHLKDLELEIQAIAIFGIDFNELAGAKLVAPDLKPGRQFSQEDVHYISPDIFVQSRGGFCRGPE